MSIPTKEQLENIRDDLDYVADKRKELDDAIDDFVAVAKENGIADEHAMPLAAASQPQLDGKSAARIAIRVILGIDIGEEPPDEDENEEPAEEEKDGEGEEFEEPEAEEPAAPTEDQLDAIRGEMQDVCDAWSELKASCNVLYKVAEKNGVSELFVDAAIDAVKDDRTGEDADEAFELAREEM